MNNKQKTCGRMPLWLNLRYNPRINLKVPRKNRLKSDYPPVSINHGGEPICVEVIGGKMHAFCGSLKLRRHFFFES
jgi:hypothetical protein